MKDIHQALISLGFHIVNPGILLLIKKGEETYILNTPDAERRMDTNFSTSSCYPAVYPDILLRVKEEEDVYCRDQSALEESQISHSPNKDDIIVKSDKIWGRKREDTQCLKDCQDTEERENNDRIKTGYEIISFTIKEDEDTYSMDHQDSERRQRINKLTGIGARNTNIKAVDSTNCTEKTPNLKARKASLKKLQNAKKGTNSEVKKERDEEENTQHESSDSNQVHSELQQGSEKVPPSHNYECESNADVAPSQPTLQQDWKPYSCPECEKSFHHRRSLLRHQKTHIAARSYPCTKCKKSFFRKEHLIRHERKHTGERPYQCAKCQKSFIQKAHLVAHQEKMEVKKTSLLREVLLHSQEHTEDL